MGSEKPIKKVMLTAIVVVDYDELGELSTSTTGRWSPVLEFAKQLEKVKGLYEIVEISNLTVSRTGNEYEEETTETLE